MILLLLKDIIDMEAILLYKKKKINNTNKHKLQISIVLSKFFFFST